MGAPCSTFTVVMDCPSDRCKWNGGECHDACSDSFPNNYGIAGCNIGSSDSCDWWAQQGRCDGEWSKWGGCFYGSAAGVVKDTCRKSCGVCQAAFHAKVGDCARISSSSTYSGK